MAGETNREILLRIERSLQFLHEKADIIMSEQDEVNADVAEVETDVAALNAATQAVKDEVAALEAQVEAGQPVDLTGLKAAVADLDTATAGAQGNVPAPPAPPA